MPKWQKSQVAEAVRACQAFYGYEPHISPTAIELGEFRANPEQPHVRAMISSAFRTNKNMREYLGLELPPKNYGLKEEQIKRWDESVKENFVRLEDYISAEDKIFFYCKKHHKMFEARPAQIWHAGIGLKCCASERNRRISANNNLKAKASYETRLKQRNPNLLLVGEYKDYDTKVKHKCLVHDEIHYITPHNALNGWGMRCCRLAVKAEDSIKNVINGSFPLRDKDCEFYIYGLKRFAGYVKVGIDSQNGARADIEYGEHHLSFYGSRVEMWLLEQAVLSYSKKHRKAPSVLFNKKWEGHTEVRYMSVDTITELAEYLYSELENLGMWEFAAKFVPMSPTEKDECMERA